MKSELAPLSPDERTVYIESRRARVDGAILCHLAGRYCDFSQVAGALIVESCNDEFHPTACAIPLADLESVELNL